MSVVSFRIGDKGVHVESYGGSGRRWIRAVAIVRETKTQWVDDVGTRWRKRDGAKVPQYCAGPRYLMSEAEWSACCGKHS